MHRPYMAHQIKAKGRAPCTTQNHIRLLMNFEGKGMESTNFQLPKYNFLFSQGSNAPL